MKRKKNAWVGLVHTRNIKNKAWGFAASLLLGAPRWTDADATDEAGRDPCKRLQSAKSAQVGTACLF